MYPRYLRVRRGRLVAGVCVGLSAHLGVDVRWVRVAFAIIAAVPLVGIAAYGALAILTDSVETPDQALNPVSEQRFHNCSQGAQAGVIGLSKLPSSMDWGLLAIGVVLAVVANLISSRYVPASIGIAIAVVGVLLVWRNTRIPDSRFGDTEHQRGEKLRGAAKVTPAKSPRPILLQWVSAIGGLIMLSVGAGVAVYLLNSNLIGNRADVPVNGRLTIGALGWAMAAGGAVLVGLMVVCIPLWLRLWQTASAAAEQRAREKEREIIASRIHDSVLQTLALIQKQSEDPRIKSVARTQERQLRQWLFGAEESVQTRTLFGAIRVASGEVEDMFQVRIRPVFVGVDLTTTNAIHELVLAAREAMANAAKHSGCDEVNVYVENIGEQIEIFVRDRGAGFDMSAVPADRHGLRDSIFSRMERIGGEVEVDSGTFGTELSFRLPLTVERTNHTHD